MKTALLIIASMMMSFLSAAELTGRIVKVSDGDTVTVLDADKTQHKIRLNRIDAPEKRQAFGQKAKEHLSGYVFGKDVRVEWEKKDKYGRILGDVYCSTNYVNLAMVKDGFAWHYKHFDQTAEYANAEKEAREKKLGLWADKNPIEPWNFRKAKKEK